jgi:hypothetical protein
MTATEQMIGRYILEHRHEVLDMNTVELGFASGTSGAAWTRFAKKMGYKGLPALKLDLAQDRTDEEMPEVDLFLDPKDCLSKLIHKTQSILEQNLRQTYELIDETDLAQAIDWMASAHRLFLCGIGGSGVVCMDLVHKLTRINRPVTYDRDTHILMAQMAHCMPGDVVLVVSYSGSTHSVNQMAYLAKEQGAKIIAITGHNLKAPLVSLADICLFIPQDEKEIRLGSVTSRDGSLIITDLLYYGVAQRQFHATKEHLVKTRKMIRKMD